MYDKVYGKDDGKDDVKDDDKADANNGHLEMEVLEKEMELAAQAEEAAQSLILIDIINVIIVVINIITVIVIIFIVVVFLIIMIIGPIFVPFWKSSCFEHLRLHQKWNGSFKLFFRFLSPWTIRPRLKVVLSPVQM